MRKIDIRLFFSAFVTGLAVLLLTGCTKENGIKADSPLSFSANVPEMIQTKSDPLTSVTSFVTAGYEGETQWFPESGKRTVSLSEGTAIFPNYIWENGSNKTFYAYTDNLFQDDGTIPNDNFGYYQAEISKNGVTLNCCAQSALAENQRDVLLGRYSGTGEGTGTAELKFYHPLAQVVFNVGNMIGVSAISKIRIGGVFLTGSTRLDMSTTTSGDPAVADFVWTGLSFTMFAPPPPDRSFNLTRDYVYQTITGDLPSTGSQLGIPFFLIPQDLESDPVTVTVTATINGVATDIEATLDSGAFETGKKTVCTLTVDPSRELGCNLAAYTADNDDDIFKKSQPANEIWYTTSDEQPIEIFPGDYIKSTVKDIFGVDLVSNTYSGGRGILTFQSDILKIGRTDGHKSPFYGNVNLTNIYLPESSVIHLEDECFAMSSGCTIYFPDTYSTDNVSARILWRAYDHTEEPFYLVTSKGMTEFVPNNVHSVYFEFANGSHYYLANGYCFAKGTLITLSDGSKKPVEEVSFKDRLKVWNFDDGHEDTADILWISPGGRRFPYYYRCTFSDGTSLNVVGEEGGSCHRIFDRTKGSFVRGHSIDVGDEIYTENGFVTLVSCEKIDEEVEFYNVVTAKHINCFTNGVLTSARYNNRYPIDQNMKFIKDGRKIRPYREFKKVGISRQWYDGMRLGEVQDSVDVVRKYINRSESLGNLNPDWKEPGFFARIWNRIKALFSK